MISIPAAAPRAPLVRCALLLLGVLAAGAHSISTEAQETALAPLEVRPGPAFLKAVERGTRSPSGEPGAAYWQQRVAYDIRASVDLASRLLIGHETVTYTNASPDTLHSVVFHLYQNLFAPGAANTRAVPLTGGITIDSLIVAGTRLAVPVLDPAAEAAISAATAPDTSAPVRVTGTILKVRLPAPLPPGGETTFAIGWHFTIPSGEGVPRMGMVDSTTAQIAQWYPQIATYDDLAGWDTRPYLSNGEFYLEYGTFDIAITAPAGAVVQATGTLVNPEDVLTEETRARLERAAASGETVHVLTEADFGPGRATRGRAGEPITWRFHAENVRDAAFALGDHYLWDAASGLADSASGRRTAVHALYRPGAKTWRESARMTRDAIEVFSRNVYPYPYAHITSSEGLVGGMEYPMIVFVRDFETEVRTQRVIAHELGHEWFPMMVGSDETAFAWLDEGVNTYITIAAAEHYYPDSRERSEIRDRYRRFQHAANTSFALMDAPDAIAVGGSEVAVLGYRKPAVALLALHEILGGETYDRALREYTRRWLYRHPSPWDFFNTFEDVAGRDLDWFWQPWFYGSGVSDLAIEAVALASGRVTISVRNEGTVLSPIRARITTADGRTVPVEAPASVWFGGQRSVRVEADVPGEVVRVELDPDAAFTDVDPEDDVWTSVETSSGAPEGGR
ncbi:MAG: M1 family metallopeptidase [Gemmatimonadetes bacterium]|nr:M1 family metallopeptidase [Gemmatimonadota bacterium]